MGAKIMSALMGTKTLSSPVITGTCGVLDCAVFSHSAPGVSSSGGKESI